MEPIIRSEEKLICQVSENLKIFANVNQYILERDNDYHKSWYYTELEAVIQDIFELKLKELASENKKKDLENLGKSIREAHDYIHKTIRPMLAGYQRKEKPTH